MTIGEKIRFYRTKLNLTQEDLAIAANTKKQTIHKYETGIVTNIPASKIKAIADKLETTPAFLMGWEDKNVIQNLNELPPILQKYNELNTIGQCKTDAYVDGLLENEAYRKNNSSERITYTSELAAFGGASKKGELTKEDIQYLTDELGNPID